MRGTGMYTLRIVSSLARYDPPSLFFPHENRRTRTGRDRPLDDDCRQFPGQVTSATTSLSFCPFSDYLSSLARSRELSDSHGGRTERRSRSGHLSSGPFRRFFPYLV